MKPILLRAPKDPFAVVSAEEAAERNIIGLNSGNLVFLEAAHKLLSVPGRVVVPDRFHYSTRDAGRINERYDAYVIPLANAFRLRFEPVLVRMTELIARLRIPVVVLGVGADGTLDGDWSRAAPIEPSVKAFVSAVLDRGPSIGVRGEMTADYLRGLGFRDTEVIGCPSMFMWGDRLRVEKRTPTLAHDARVSITVSPYVTAMGPIVMRHLERYPNLTYVAQDLKTLDMLVWGEPPSEAAKRSPIPVHTSHPLFAQDRVRFYVAPWPWIEDLRDVDFSFGTRIHGAIAAVLAGTPAVVLAHDSRTLELARYFGIPHRPMSDVDADVDAADLYAEADFTSLNGGHAARFATFSAYLARHGLDHAFTQAGAAEAWDARAAATPYPPALRASRVGDGPGGSRVRLGRLRWRVHRVLRLGAIRGLELLGRRRPTSSARG